MNIFKKLIVTLLFTVSVAGCNPEPQNREPQYGKTAQQQGKQNYMLAVHPLYNPQKLIQTYQPLVDHLSKQSNSITFEIVEPSKDYSSFESKIRDRVPHFLLPNPWQTLEAMKFGYTVIAMAGRAEDFKGTFIVRRDSVITKPSDLKGKAVSYPAATALAACIMPQYFLHKQGINVTTQIENRYVGSQESSIMNVYLGSVAAGVTWPIPWRSFQKDHPKEAAELKVMWETPHLINNSFMVRNDVPVEIREQIRTHLLQLHTTPEGRSILAGMETDRFYPASNDDYEIVRSYVAQFERDVRIVDGGKK
ncbi:MAG TPA: phosphate/phosphite/phosphonate ABC transporter substrate-binding protein [Desulfuromonadales bacterium]|nr:phosphate/phosphite/phosphonate ABC transporter substrate-binding protein [Desulfuromonadales bacterium]